jgi:hypothetical protein
VPELRCGAGSITGFKTMSKAKVAPTAVKGVQLTVGTPPGSFKVDSACFFAVAVDTTAPDANAA